jgi:hypothetical protein
MTIPDDFPSPPKEWGDTSKLRRRAFRSVESASGRNPRLEKAEVHDDWVRITIAYVTPGGQEKFTTATQNLHGKGLPL